ncbi:elongation factor G [Flammeovirgaceae bacterium SG7u.111]|nr:elongation factor G [Flammeovirgaceae bacterium SG7u.132]WPO38254.1 elongation factor G [Flammeovirgaceae bacterium SG7u.111]
MKVFDNKHIKNVVLLGSAKAGKTTLAETMLFEAGIIGRRGTVEDKNTVSDFHEIEHERGYSIYATSLHTEWRNYKINIIDTPGLDDFSGEIVSSVRVADTCIMVLNGQTGVEVGTELIWNYVDTFKKPTLIAINQVDGAKADFNNSFEQAKATFGDAVTLMQYPVDSGANFSRIVDLLKMKMYIFPADGGKPEKFPIPEAELEKANQLHNELVEKAAENDEDLMELYFEKGNLSEDELRKGLKIGMMNHDVFPVFCLSAKQNKGSGRMMGFIDNVAPAANELYPEVTVDGKEVACDPSRPASVFVFKTLVEPYLGRITFFKVCSGEVKVGMDLVNSQTDNTDRINQLFIMDGKERHPVEKLVAGDIGATVKLKDTQTNHTLHAKGFEVTYDPMLFPEPKVRMAIRAEDKNDEDKMAEVIREMHEEDPTLQVEYANELKQLIMSGQGELHLQLAKWRLENIYKMGIEFYEPKIPYRETIRKKATSSYRHKKQSGGAGQFAEVTLTVIPYKENMPKPSDFNIRGEEVVDLEWGGKLVFYNCIVGGVIDARYIPSVLKGVMEVMEDSPLTRSYARDVCVFLHDGKMHPVDSNDISFKIAGAHAFKECFVNADPLIMEPIQNIEVRVPEDLVGDVMTDLQGRRALIMGIDSNDRFQIINAKIPLAELGGYSSSLKSHTQGRASFKTSYSGYEQVSNDIQQKLIKEGDLEMA